MQMWFYIPVTGVNRGTVVGLNVGLALPYKLRPGETLIGEGAEKSQECFGPGTAILDSLPGFLYSKGLQTTARGPHPARDVVLSGPRKNRSSLT
jgi:hypothetical protein